VVFNLKGFNSPQLCCENFSSVSNYEKKRLRLWFQESNELTERMANELIEKIYVDLDGVRVVEKFLS